MPARALREWRWSTPPLHRNTTHNSVSKRTFNDTYRSEPGWATTAFIALLGRGGMADVYRAEDERLGREVALKALPPEFARDPGADRALRAGGASCGQAQPPEHRHRPRVRPGGGALHFYTMALMPGGDLKARIRANPNGMPPAEARAVAAAVARALDYAHRRGYAHRDVKPENILFGEEGTPQLTDFGIARAMESGTRMTATGMSIGSPHYMGPEQAQGLEVDGRSDLYSLGVVLYEMLTGRLPFDAPNTFAVGLSHIKDPAPELPPELAAWQPTLDRLLAKSPEDRYASARELAEVLASGTPSGPQSTRVVSMEPEAELSSAASLRPQATRVVPLGPDVDPARRDEERPTWLEEPAQPRRSVVGAVLGTVLALAVVGIVYLALRDSKGPERVPTDGGGGGEEVRPAPEGLRLPSNPVNPPERTPYGSLTLELEPRDARVTLPDVDPRYRPGVRLPEGPHRVVVRHRGYREATRTIDLSGDTRVRIALEKKQLRAGESRVFDDIEFVWIPPGEFRLGSTSRHADSDEKPVTGVRLTRGFWLGKYEVTQAQWESVMGSNPSRFKNCGGNCPVERVSWNDVQEFIGKLNRRLGGRPYRLPTEAEWEYAARGGTTADTYAGDLTNPRGNDPVLNRIAWYRENSGRRTHPVGRKAPNGWGLHDMLGNVWEWVGDWYGDYPGGDGDGPVGSWVRLDPGEARRLLGQLRQDLPVGGSPRVFAGRPQQLSRLPPAEDGITLGAITLLPLAAPSARGRAGNREGRARQRPSRAENRPPSGARSLLAVTSVLSRPSALQRPPRLARGAGQARRPPLPDLHQQDKPPFPSVRTPIPCGAGMCLQFSGFVEANP